MPQNYTFLGELPNNPYTFLGELCCNIAIFLDELCFRAPLGQKSVLSKSYIGFYQKKCDFTLKVGGKMCVNAEKVGMKTCFS